MKKKNSLIILFFMILLFSISCEERDRDNIFDPKNKNKTIDIGFQITSNDSSIVLSWNSPRNIKHKSFNIFRKDQGDKEALLYKIVDKAINNFIDHDIIFDSEYLYYLTINGETEESFPTETLKITAGPGIIWILDTYLWDITRLNYDLSSVAFRKPAVWRPENIAFAQETNLALVTYPLFRDFEIFDINTGDFIAGNRDLGRPFDAVYDNNNNNFWLVDSSGSLYTIDTVDANALLVTQELSKPIQIDIFNQNLYVLDQGLNKILIFDTSPQLIDSIFFSPDSVPFVMLQQFRIDDINNNIYFIDGKKNENTLYKYDLLNKQIFKLYQDTLIYSFDVDPMNETIWIIIAKHLNSNLVQLSGNVIRHFEISELERPVDIKVNPVNGNFVIADFKFEENIKVPKVFHFRPDVTLIGSYSTYGDPSKVYIE